MSVVGAGLVEGAWASWCSAGLPLVAGIFGSFSSIPGEIHASVTAPPSKSSQKQGLNVRSGIDGTRMDMRVIIANGGHRTGTVTVTVTLEK